MSSQTRRWPTGSTGAALLLIIVHPCRCVWATGPGAYVAYFNGARPHQGIDHQVPLGVAPAHGGPESSAPNRDTPVSGTRLRPRAHHLPARFTSDGPPASW